MSERFDDAVVGAGIVGLAHAYHLAKRGRRVAVFERSPQAMGASVRNFGMLWPIGQPAGQMHRIALRSREIWQEVLAASGLWHEEVGSLHLAYREDEAQVLREFAESAPRTGYACEMLEPAEVLRRAPAVQPEGLLAGLWSATEICVDPREIIAGLPGFLAREYGVHFAFDCAVSAYDQPRLVAGGQTWEADHLTVCSGDDFQTLYPEVLRAMGMIRCKLQMMRSQPYGSAWRIGPMLAAGLTLRHYRCFETCPSLAALKRRVAEESPEFDQFGIHVMASQNGYGELTLGDSHEYGAAITPFDKERIDLLILDYLRTFLIAPDLRIASRWHGVYAKHPDKPYVTASPAPGVTIVTGVGGSGMTLSFGLAEHLLSRGAQSLNHGSESDQALEG